jgi:hypothetical protein
LTNNASHATHTAIPKTIAANSSSTYSTIPFTTTPSYTVTNASTALSNNVLVGSALNHVITEFSQASVLSKAKVLDKEK